MATGDRPAFPIVDPDGVIASSGLTKRELFAAMAMQGFCADRTFADASDKVLALCALARADALLAELAMEAS